MKDRGWMDPSTLEPIVERVVGQVLDANSVQLRSEIVRRVMEEIAAEAATAEAVTAEATPKKRPVSPASRMLLRPAPTIWRVPLPKSRWVPHNERFCAPYSIPAPAMPPALRFLS